MAYSRPSLLLLAAISVTFFDLNAACNTPGVHPSRIGTWRVSTPAEYERLTPGGVPEWRVIINAAAHPNVLGEAKRWSNSYFDSIAFTDKYSNAISLQPQYRKVFATFTNGADLLAHLPTDYTHYSVRIGANVAITADDIHVIEQWKAAKALEFYDENGFAAKLIEHSALLKENQEVELLALSVERRSFEEIEVERLFAQMSGMQWLGLGVRDNSGLVEADLRAFAERQVVPDDFEVKFYDGSYAITYTKRGFTRSLHPY